MFFVLDVTSVMKRKNFYWKRYIAKRALIQLDQGLVKVMIF